MIQNTVRPNSQTGQQHLGAFVEAIHSESYPEAHRLFEENLHPIALALYPIFLEHEPRLYSHSPRQTESIFFQRSMLDFNLERARRWYSSNPEAVGRFLRNYFEHDVARGDFEQQSEMRISN